MCDLPDFLYQGDREFSGYGSFVRDPEAECSLWGTMSVQDEQGRYRVETWSAVGTLWNAFGEKPDELVISMYPNIPAFIDEMFEQGRTPEWTAVQIVAQVVTDNIARSFTAEQKKQMLAELDKLTQMKFEEAHGYMAYPLVHTLVNAWQVTQKWIDEGRVDGSASKFLMGKFVAALTSGPQ